MSLKSFWLLGGVGIVCSLPLRPVSWHAASLIGGEGGTSLNSSQSAASLENGVYVEPKGILWVENTSEFIIGVILVVIASTASWFFERQMARLECLVSIGRSNCVTVPNGEALPENYGQLVHLSGQSLRPESPIQDPRFVCTQLGNKCTRLRTQVQAFQNGASPKWSEETCPKAPAPALSVGTTIANARSVGYGTNFLLPDGLIDQCNDFHSGAKLLGTEVFSHSKMRFQQHDGYFYWRPGLETWTAQQVAQEPREGDLRCRFEVTYAAAATVLALQVACDDRVTPATLLPYRLVPNFPFGEDEKQLRVQEARKSRIGLALEDQICRESRLCCSCNFVAGCCTGVATPEIFRLFEGNRPIEACFAELRKTSNLDVGFGTWTFRLLVLAVLTGGIYMSFSEALLHIYPVMSNVRAPSARITTSISVALSLTAGVISVAFFPYKIGKSFIYMTLVIVFVLFPVILLC